MLGCWTHYLIAPIPENEAVRGFRVSEDAELKPALVRSSLIKLTTTPWEKEGVVRQRGESWDLFLFFDGRVCVSFLGRFFGFRNTPNKNKAHLFKNWFEKKTCW